MPGYGAFDGHAFDDDAFDTDTFEVVTPPSSAWTAKANPSNAAWTPKAAPSTIWTSEDDDGF